jgi:hypothetical protein
MPKARIEVIADTIRSEWGKGIDSQFVIGRLLSEARASFGESDKAYGKWVAEQEFGFSVSYAYRLRWAAENESAVRGYLESRASRTGKGPGPEVGVAGAVVALNRKPKTPEVILPGEAEVADPALSILRTARNTILGWDGEQATANLFTDAHIEDLREAGTIIKALAAAYSEARTARG